MTAAIPVALTIAGSDSSGGAGIEADLKTFAALGVYGCTAITALTAQNTQGVAAVMPIPAAFTRKQLDAIAADLDVLAVKTGMLGTAETVETVAAVLGAHDFGPLILDPVMVATSGDLLVPPDAVDAMRRALMPLAALATPNLHEAARLLNASLATGLRDMEEQAKALLAFGAKAVLVKGGHGAGEIATDVLAYDGGVRSYELPRLHGAGAHGTGCTLAAAIAAFTARGEPMTDAIGLAKRYVWRAMESARRHPIGKGGSPLDHAYATREGPPPK